MLYRVLVNFRYDIHECQKCFQKLIGRNCMSIDKRACNKYVTHVVSNDIAPTAYLHTECLSEAEYRCLHRQTTSHYLAGRLKYSRPVRTPL